jgi:predicted nucleotide-binding protein
MAPFEELINAAKRLTAAGAAADTQSVAPPLRAVADAADEMKRSFSGSWLGYHSRVYYQGLAPAPPGAHFSQEWGLKDLGYSSLGSRGDWEEFDPEQVKSVILSRAHSPDLEPARKAAREANAVFEEIKAEVISVFEIELAEVSDPFLTRLKGDLEKLEPLSTFDVAQHWAPKGQIMTRDTLALGQRNMVPPHVDLLAEVASINNSFGICKAAADVCTRAASHLERKSRKKAVSARVGTNVFIGHGRSSDWRALKDFVQDRLGLPWDEFNRVPVAGVTNIARLSEMLEAAAVALLVMTAEDELADGDIQARMNVVHEAGLFQGRLGFTKAIVLLEEGCKEFSNIQGLGQIKFPQGNISAAFEEVRRVLEREGLIGGIASCNGATP